MSDREEAFVKLGWWPNEIMWKVFNQGCDHEVASMQAKLDALEAENARLKDVREDLKESRQRCGQLESMRWNEAAAFQNSEKVLLAENARLRAALQSLAKLGNGDKCGNSIGNQIARDALKGGVLTEFCKKCGGVMRSSKAIEQTWTGKPDFIGDTSHVTLSPGGSGNLIGCMKCEQCGWSVTGGEQ